MSETVSFAAIATLTNSPTVNPVSPLILLLNVYVEIPSCSARNRFSILFPASVERNRVAISASFVRTSSFLKWPPPSKQNVNLIYLCILIPF